MIKNCTLHHIGYVVADIKTTAEQFLTLSLRHPNQRFSQSSVLMR